MRGEGKSDGGCLATVDGGWGGATRGAHVSRSTWHSIFSVFSDIQEAE